MTKFVHFHYLCFILLSWGLIACEMGNTPQSPQLGQTTKDSTSATNNPEPTVDDDNGIPEVTENEDETEVTEDEDETKKPKIPNFENEDWGDNTLFDKNKIKRMAKQVQQMQEIFMQEGEPSVPLKTRVDCQNGAASDDQIENIKETIRKKHMDQGKLTAAKVLVNDICLKSSHVRDITELFMMDDAKLNFAKFAFGRTTDPENYKKVAQAITFPAKKKKLKAYVIEKAKEYFDSDNN